MNQNKKNPDEDILLKKILEAESYLLGMNLLETCINYIGMHRLLDFNILEPSLKTLFYALFTKYNSPKVAREYMSWLPVLKEGIAQNNIAYLKNNLPGLLEQLVDFTMFKFEHYSILREVILGNQSIQNLNDFLDKSPYLINKEYWSLDFFEWDSNLELSDELYNFLLEGKINE